MVSQKGRLLSHNPLLRDIPDLVVPSAEDEAGIGRRQEEAGNHIAVSLHDHIPVADIVQKDIPVAADVHGIRVTVGNDIPGNRVSVSVEEEGNGGENPGLMGTVAFGIRREIPEHAGVVNEVVAEDAVRQAFQAYRRMEQPVAFLKRAARADELDLGNLHALVLPALRVDIKAVIRIVRCHPLVEAHIVGGARRKVRPDRAPVHIEPLKEAGVDFRLIAGAHRALQSAEAELAELRLVHPRVGQREAGGGKRIVHLQEGPRVHPDNIPLNAQVPDQAAFRGPGDPDTEGGKRGSPQAQLRPEATLKDAVGVGVVGPDVAFEAHAGLVNLDRPVQIVLGRRKMHASGAGTECLHHLPNITE